MKVSIILFLIFVGLPLLVASALCFFGAPDRPQDRKANAIGRDGSNAPAGRRLRIVAFNPNSISPSGYYAIEVYDGWRWKRVYNFIDTCGKWNPVLELYDDAKRLAESWKDEAVYRDWCERQEERAAEYKEREAARARKLYPNMVEEV